MAVEIPTWKYKLKGDKQTASEMNQLAQSVIANANELSSIKDDVTELSNKTHDPGQWSGLGRIYLRKNVQTIIDPSTGAVINVNLLTQSMLAKENTI